MKDKSTTLNTVVDTAGYIISMKVRYCESVAQSYFDQGNIIQANEFIDDAKLMRQAVDIINKYQGCWGQL